MKCRKRRFTRVEAQIALARATMRADRGAKRRQEERAYKCGCGWWHLTSQPLATRRGV